MQPVSQRKSSTSSLASMEAPKSRSVSRSSSQLSFIVDSASKKLESMCHLVSVTKFVVFAVDQADP